jgi:hypothetical protein
VLLDTGIMRQARVADGDDALIDGQIAINLKGGILRCARPRSGYGSSRL